jgi:hypothetical protein
MSIKRGHRIHLAGAGAIGLSHYGRAWREGMPRPRREGTNRQ